MAAREINLIQTKTQISPQEQLLRTMVKIWTPIIGIGFVLVLFGVIFFKLRYQQEQQALQAQVASQEQSIASLITIEGSVALLKQKLRVSADVVNNRFPYSDVFSWLTAYRSSDLTLRSVTVSEDGKLLVNATARDSYLVDTFIHDLLEQSKRYKRLELTALDRVSDGSYHMAFEFIVAGKEEAPQNPS